MTGREIEREISKDGNTYKVPLEERKSDTLVSGEEMERTCGKSERKPQLTQAWKRSGV